MSTKIIICYHKTFDIYKNEVLIPLHVGKENSSITINGTLGDNTGENISIKNKSYCELTGLYWLWKNIEADNYGLFHYRRFLDIKNKYKGQTYPSNFDITDWDKENLDSLMENHDIILPQKLKLKVSQYDYYKQRHISKDLDIIKTIIEKKYPNYVTAMQQALNSQWGYFCNMFIMKKDIFNEYCSWLFDILSEAEELIDTTDYDSYQSRVLGFLSERMVNIFIQYKKESSPNLRIKEVNFLIVNPEPVKKINFLIGQYIKFPEKIFFEILGLKFSKKLGVKNGK